ncbi:MAG TPA: TlpA disulfide reductase family protein [Steroidobacteraceae bacterium]
MLCENRESLKFLSRREVLKGCATLFVAGSSLRGHSCLANELRIGAKAPPATLVTFDGQKISTADLTGHVVILTFWATWCVPCRDELPLLSNYAVQHAEAGLRVLGFCLDEPDQLSEALRVAQTLRFPTGLFANSSAPGYGRIWRLPVNFTIDRAGRLVQDGWKEKKPSWTPERLEQIVTPILTSDSQ